MENFIKIVQTCGFGIIGFMFPKILVASGVPLEAWAVELGLLLSSAKVVITADVVLTSAAIILAIIFMTIEFWLRPVGRITLYLKGGVKGEESLSTLASIDADMQRSMAHEGLQSYVPDMRIYEAMEHVVQSLFPDRDPSYIDIGKEERPAVEAIMTRIKSGELKSWGKRTRVCDVYAEGQYAVDLDRDSFSLEDWKNRELLPLEASLPEKTSPQTRSIGRDDGHIQFTDIYVNESQVRKIKW